MPIEYRILPNVYRISVRRQIFKRILLFDTFFARSDRCERTIEIPIIQVNQGKTRSANVNPFQARQNIIQIVRIFVFYNLLE